MTETQTTNTSTTSAKNKAPLIVYILYLSSIVLGLTGIIGLIVAYVCNGDASESDKTHYRFQIRTFWIGFLYSMIAVVLSAVFIGWLLFPVIGIWFIVRCVKGLIAFNEGKPIENPTRWMF